MADDYRLDSYFKSRIALLAYPSGGTIASSLTVAPADCLAGALNVTPPSVTKNKKGYTALDGNGWEEYAALGQSLGEVKINCVRRPSEGVYTGATGTGTYQRLRYWSDQANENGGETSRRLLVIITPVGNDYEAKIYRVFPTEFNDGELNTDDGQTYDISCQPCGPVIYGSVEYTSATDTFTITVTSNSNG